MDLERGLGDGQSGTYGQYYQQQYRREHDRYRRDRGGQFSHTDQRGTRPPPPRQRGTRHEGHRTPPTHDRERRHEQQHGHTAAPSAPSRHPKSGPMRRGERSGRVRELQRLLDALGIAKGLKADGRFGLDTERGVKILQAKLGMSQTGHASNALMKRLRDAEILSPCANGAKRSKEMDDLDELIRSVEDRYDDEPEEEGDDLDQLVPVLSRCCPSEHTFAREWPLDDIVIRAGGDGRTVEAYAAVFGQPVEIKDQHGHYLETIDRAAFNEVLAGGINNVGCFYHHGMTLHGTPSDLGSVPIGSPIDIRADGHGLRTVTRFNKSALADSVLEAIRAGDLRGYSFRGAIRRSNPPRIARARDGQPLPTVTRMSLGLNEYGPTPTPYYADAKILAVRSVQQIAQDPEALLELQRELAYQLSRSTPRDQEQESATPTEGPGAEDQHDVHSGRHQADIARKIARARILMGVQQ